MTINDIECLHYTKQGKYNAVSVLHAMHGVRYKTWLDHIVVGQVTFCQFLNADSYDKLIFSLALFTVLLLWEWSLFKEWIRWQKYLKQFGQFTVLRTGAETKRQKSHAHFDWVSIWGLLKKEFHVILPIDEFMIRVHCIYIC